MELFTAEMKGHYQFLYISQTGHLNDMNAPGPTESQRQY